MYREWCVESVLHTRPCVAETGNGSIGNHTTPFIFLRSGVQLDRNRAFLAINRLLTRALLLNEVTEIIYLDRPLGTAHSSRSDRSRLAATSIPRRTHALAIISVTHLAAGGSASCYLFVTATSLELCGTVRNQSEGKELHLTLHGLVVCSPASRCLALTPAT